MRAWSISRAREHARPRELKHGEVRAELRGVDQAHELPVRRRDDQRVAVLHAEPPATQQHAEGTDGEERHVVQVDHDRPVGQGVTDGHPELVLSADVHLASDGEDLDRPEDAGVDPQALRAVRR